ncbi:MAG: type II toxin-antitoxin system RelE/ParE family toxin [Pseudomonadota bacterium]
MSPLSDVFLDKMVAVTYKLHMFRLIQSDTYKEWFERLRDPIADKQIRKRLARMIFGHFGDAKSLGDGLYELRFKIGPGYRIYYTQVGQDILVLLSGGDKGSQSRDIERAREIRKDYLDGQDG